MSSKSPFVIDERTFSISDAPTEEEMARVQNEVEQDKRTQTFGEYDQPGVEINLVLKDAQGQVQGGVIASTVFHVMHLEVLWVSEDLRGKGYGSQLVLGAEQIGFASGCRTSQTWTFSFQGTEFYPTIGYKRLGIYDGYPNGITEHVFMKRLAENHSGLREHGVPDSRGLYLTTEVNEADKKILHDGLHRHVIKYVGEGYLGTKIKLIIKDQEGQLTGGLSAWTTLSNLIFETIWIDERFRGKGLGSVLMLEMERIARQAGCIASQAYCFSFQAPGFFQKMGYTVLGISNGYPAPVEEYYLIKKYH
jgi:ribosomal protein S18 acetylase RimI-like enzyme